MVLPMATTCLFKTKEARTPLGWIQVVFTYIGTAKVEWNRTQNQHRCSQDHGIVDKKFVRWWLVCRLRLCFDIQSHFYEALSGAEHNPSFFKFQRTSYSRGLRSAVDGPVCVVLHFRHFCDAIATDKGLCWQTKRWCRGKWSDGEGR